MTTQHSASAPPDGCGPLSAADLDAVVALDAAMTGRSRRRFLARRLDRTLATPGRYVHMALRRDGRLAGFALARLTEGEFGAPDGTAVLDAFGIAREERGRGAGRALLDAISAVLRRKGVREVLTEVDWADQGLMGFLAGNGFGLAPRQVLGRSVSPDNTLQAPSGKATT